jgi:hypothetical protein
VKHKEEVAEEDVETDPPQLRVVRQPPRRKRKKADAAVEVDPRQKVEKLPNAVAMVVEEVVIAITMTVNTEVVEEEAKEEVVKNAITVMESHASRTKTSGSTNSTRKVSVRPTITKSISPMIWKFLKFQTNLVASQLLKRLNLQLLLMNLRANSRL